MRLPATMAILTLLLALVLVASACAAAPTPTPTSAPTSTPAPNRAPAQAAAVSPTAAVQATATRAPAAATPAPAGAATGGSALNDLMARARANTEYSVEFRMTAGTVPITGKSFFKGKKMRQEMGTGQEAVVVIVDLDTKEATNFMPALGLAFKVDFTQVAMDAQRPDDRVGQLPANARQVGTETVDGKPAVVFEFTEQAATNKMWIWAEKGVPLKVETTAAGQKTLIEYLNYQFTPQPDNLFTLPAGVSLMDIPVPPGGGVPNVPNVPIPGR